MANIVDSIANIRGGVTNESTSGGDGIGDGGCNSFRYLVEDPTCRHVESCCGLSDFVDLGFSSLVHGLRCVGSVRASTESRFWLGSAAAL